MCNSILSYLCHLSEGDCFNHNISLFYDVRCLEVVYLPSLRRRIKTLIISEMSTKLYPPLTWFLRTLMKIYVEWGCFAHLWGFTADISIPMDQRRTWGGGIPCKKRISHSVVPVSTRTPDWWWRRGSPRRWWWCTGAATRRCAP